MNAFKTFLKFSVLILVGIVTVATSKEKDMQSVHDRPADQYLVASNCPSAVTQDTVNVVDNQITLPADRKFKDFGFPVEDVKIGQSTTYSGVMPTSGQTRNCSYYLYQITTPRIHLYSCADNFVNVCQITFEEKSMASDTAPSED